MKVTALPFELDRDEAHGFHVPAEKIQGVIHLESEGLVVSFEIEGAADDGSMHSVRIPLVDIVDVELTGGAVKSPRLVLEVAREEILEALPWADGCVCVVRFRRADAVRAQEFVTETELRLAELK